MNQGANDTTPGDDDATTKLYRVTMTPPLDPADSNEDDEAKAISKTLERFHESMQFSCYRNANVMLAFQRRRPDVAPTTDATTPGSTLDMPQRSLDKEAFNAAANAGLFPNRHTLPDGTAICRELDLRIGDCVLGYSKGSPAWVRFTGTATTPTANGRAYVLRRTA